jgi:hypothetical protein
MQLWDVTQTTVSDFSIFTFIPEKLWTTWNEKKDKLDIPVEYDN